MLRPAEVRGVGGGDRCKGGRPIGRRDLRVEGEAGPGAEGDDGQPVALSHGTDELSVGLQHPLIRGQPSLAALQHAAGGVDDHDEVGWYVAHLERGDQVVQGGRVLH